MRSTNITAQVPPQHPLRAAAGWRLFFPRSLASHSQYSLVATLLRLLLTRSARCSPTRAEVRRRAAAASINLSAILTKALCYRDTTHYIRPHTHMHEKNQQPERVHAPHHNGGRGAPGAPRPTTDKNIILRSASKSKTLDGGRVRE